MWVVLVARPWVCCSPQNLSVITPCFMSAISRASVRIPSVARQYQCSRRLASCYCAPLLQRFACPAAHTRPASSRAHRKSPRKLAARVAACPFPAGAPLLPPPPQRLRLAFLPQHSRRSREMKATNFSGQTASGHPFSAAGSTWFCGRAGLRHRTPLRWSRRSGRALFWCAACDNPLFESKVKFDSGTGWPSYAAPLAGVEVVEKNVLKEALLESQVRCAKCGGHLGDVFADGFLFPGTPAALTGKRYCIGAALVFKPADGSPAVLGEGKARSPSCHRGCSRPRWAARA